MKAGIRATGTLMSYCSAGPCAFSDSDSDSRIRQNCFGLRLVRGHRTASMRDAPIERQSPVRPPAAHPDPDRCKSP